MAVSLYVRYREAILAGDVNVFRELPELSQNEVDLRRHILVDSTNRDLILAAFEKNIVCRRDIHILSECLNDAPDFVMWLLENMNHEAMRNYRHPETGETLLQRYMYACSVDCTALSSDATALYMIETVGIDPLVAAHTPAPELLINVGYIQSIAKLISMGVALGPIDKIIDSLNIYICNLLLWRTGCVEQYNNGLVKLANLITMLQAAGYACLTDAIRERITTNGFCEACPALALAIA